MVLCIVSIYQAEDICDDLTRAIVFCSTVVLLSIFYSVLFDGKTFIDEGPSPLLATRNSAFWLAVRET